MPRGATDDGLLTLLLIGAGAFAFIYWARNSQAAAAEAGGLNFESTAPAGGVIDQAANILLPMEVSSAGAAFIAANEGFVATPSGEGTIGYGHTIRAGEQFNTPMTQREAVTLLGNDLNGAGGVADTINRTVMVPLSQSQFDALASLCYNIGAGAFANSTLVTDLNNYDYQSAADQFAAWNISQGRVNSGLVARRGREQQLFGTGAGTGTGSPGTGTGYGYSAGYG